MRNFSFAMVVLVCSAFFSPAEGAPIQGISPRTQFFLGTAYRSFVNVSRKANGDDNLHVVQIPQILSYALKTDATVNLVVPYVIKERRLSDKTHRDARGVGDTRVFGKYRFYRNDFPFGRTQMAIIGGLELPTGDTTKEKDGVRLPRPLQLGSGGVDPFFAFAAGWVSFHHALEGGVQLKYNARHNGFRFGVETDYDLAYAYRIFPDWPIPSQLNFLLEVNGKHRERNKSGGSKVANSGGDVLFLSPGLQYIFLDNALVEASVQFPVLEKANGDQLHQDYRVLFGFRVLF